MLLDSFNQAGLTEHVFFLKDRFDSEGIKSTNRFRSMGWINPFRPRMEAAGEVSQPADEASV
jgi:hypothetical protein